MSVKSHVCEKDYIWNPSTCSCENVSIMGDSVTTCDEIIESYKIKKQEIFQQILMTRK